MEIRPSGITLTPALSQGEGVYEFNRYFILTNRMIFDEKRKFVFAVTMEEPAGNTFFAKK